MDAVESAAVALLSGISPLTYLDWVGTERVLMDRILHRAEQLRVARVRDTARAIGGEVAKALSGKS